MTRPYTKGEILELIEKWKEAFCANKVPFTRDPHYLKNIWSPSRSHGAYVALLFLEKKIAKGKSL